ncbi:hypothetical protein Ga0080559_TMP400 (plasmid) [Salipiger profundus]|uniref:Uncharacterized protein n=1 Tax=Salipiger profundus TaxID=1229727 RepID=A0A1U7DCM9_9RHOB|nr:hypothetical protein Ga0080559_TMP400 [Salipiger profundus]
MAWHGVLHGSLVLRYIITIRRPIEPAQARFQQSRRPLRRRLRDGGVQLTLRPAAEPCPPCTYDRADLQRCVLFCTAARRR